MLINGTSRIALSTAMVVLIGLLAAPVASAESFEGTDRLVRGNRIVGHVKSVLIQDNTTSVAVDARVRDFVAPRVPMSYRSRLVVNLTCADRGSDPSDSDHALHVDRLRFLGPWTMNRITSTRTLLLAQPLFARCPTGQVIERYLVRFQVIDSEGSLVGRAFVAPSTPLL